MRVHLISGSDYESLPDHSSITESSPKLPKVTSGLKNRKLKGNLENFKSGSFNGRVNISFDKTVEVPLTAVVDVVESPSKHLPCLPVQVPTLISSTNTSSSPSLLRSRNQNDQNAKENSKRSSLPSSTSQQQSSNQATNQALYRKKKHEFSINIERPISDLLKQSKTGSLDVNESTEEFVNDFISREMNFKRNSVKSPPIITVRDASEGDTFFTENDNISLYGTPKEEVGPVFAEAKASFMRNQIESLFQASDNKLAMKLFGSKKALMNERLRQKESGHWIIHPCSNFR